MIQERHKMKKLLVGVLSLLLVLNVFSATNKTDLEINGLKGKVKEWIQINYDIKNKVDGDVKKPASKYINKYDNKGNLVEWALYYKDGPLTWKAILKYDDKGNKFEEARYNGKGLLYCKNIPKYDVRGNLIEWAWYYEDGSSSGKYIYKYDDTGNLVEWADYAKSGDLRRKYIYKYDDKGNAIEKAMYNENGALWKKTVSKYDNKGDQVEEAIYNEKDFLIGKKSISKFDDNGNKIEDVTYDKKGILKHVTISSFTYYSADERSTGADNKPEPDVKQTIQQERFNRFISDICAKVPDFMLINASDSFNEWLKQSDGFSDRSLQDGLNNATGKFDVDAAVKIINAYKSQKQQRMEAQQIQANKDTAPAEKMSQIQERLICFASFIAVGIFVIALFLLRKYASKIPAKDKIIRFYSIPDILFYIYLILILGKELIKHGFSALSLEGAILALAGCLASFVAFFAFFIPYNFIFRKATTTRFIVGMFYGGLAGLLLSSNLYCASADNSVAILYLAYIIAISVFLIALGFLFIKYASKIPAKVNEQINNNMKGRMSMNEKSRGHQHVGAPVFREIKIIIASLVLGCFIFIIGIYFELPICGSYKTEKTVSRRFNAETTINQKTFIKDNNKITLIILLPYILILGFRISKYLYKTVNVNPETIPVNPSPDRKD